MSEHGSLEGANWTLIAATYNKLSVFPFPRSDISKTNHLPFFHFQISKVVLTLRIPILEKLSPNTSSFPGTPIHYLYFITTHPPTVESRRDIHCELPRNIALRRELAVQIVCAQTITALIRRPRAANLLA